MTAVPPSALAAVTIRGVRARAVHLQVRRPLETASGSFATWPVMLLDLETDAGVAGHSYVGCFLPMMLKPLASLLGDLGGLIAGDALRPLDLERKLRAATRLIGTHGPLATAVALIEIAAWDAAAKAAGVPLAALFGAAPRAFPVYKTLISMDPGKAAELAEEAVAEGYGGVKLKLGNPVAARDTELVRRVREVVGDGFAMMGDYNQVLSVPEAIARIRALDEAGLVWIEEPTLARDYAGHARIATAVATPLQIGENWLGLADAADCLRAGASAYAMPDVVKIGGISAWLRSSVLAEAHGVPVSAHSFPEICAHLLPAAGNAHWLEHVGMADAVFLHKPKADKGMMAALPAAGNGIAWDEDVVGRSLVG